MVEPTYILTARNVLSAHLTMFHKLSAAQVGRLSSITLPVRPIEVTFDSLRFLGAGVAYNVRSPDLVRLRGEIAATMADELSRQDSQKWTPHVTVQNKVPADTAKKLFATLDKILVVRGGHVTGLQVFEYLGGPWKLAREFPFEKPATSDS
jgi:2'-5' RNA ligase